jgi:hypothetical protein
MGRVEVRSIVEEFLQLSTINPPMRRNCNISSKFLMMVSLTGKPWMFSTQFQGPSRDFREPTLGQHA